MAAHKLYAVADIEALEATIKAQAAIIANLRARVSELTARSVPPSIKGTDRVLARELMRGPMTRAELAAVPIVTHPIIGSGLPSWPATGMRFARTLSDAFPETRAGSISGPYRRPHRARHVLAVALLALLVAGWLA